MHDLSIILLAATPISELRGALVLALGPYHFSVARALLDAYIGNALPVFPLLFGLQAATDWVMTHSPVIHRWFERFFSRTREHLQGRYEKHGALALFLWVALTVPPTGVWSACVAAVLFGVRPKVAIPAILGGMIVSGIVVTAITKGLIVGINSI